MLGPRAIGETFVQRPRMSVRVLGCRNVRRHQGNITTFQHFVVDEEEDPSERTG